MRAKATCTLHSMHLCSFAGPEIRDQSAGTVWKVLQNQTNRRWFLSYWSRWICFFHWHELLSTTLKSCTAVQHTDLVCGEHSCRFLQAIWGSQYQRGRCLLLWQLEPPAAGHISVWEGWSKGRFWPMNSLTIPYHPFPKDYSPQLFSHRNLGQVQTQRVLIHETWHDLMLLPPRQKPHVSSNKSPAR